MRRLRKQRARDGFAGELDMEKELARGPGGKTPMNPGQRIRPGGQPLCAVSINKFWCIVAITS